MRGECMTVSVEEAGKALGCSRNIAYEAVRRGEIPVIRIGKLLRVPKAALERLLNGVDQAGATTWAEARTSAPRRSTSEAA